MFSVRDTLGEPEASTGLPSLVKMFGQMRACARPPGSTGPEPRWTPEAQAYTPST